MRPHYQHHDPELCRRLAERVMGWKSENELRSVIGYLLWDPCCNPAHNWMLEQQILNTPVPGVFYEEDGSVKGKEVLYTIDKRARVSPFSGELESQVMLRPETSQQIRPPRLVNIHTGDGHPLLALSLAADAATKEEENE